MKIVDVYDKEYKCSKCGSSVNYGKVSDNDGKIVTKDRKPNNNKFGKESNVLSAAVNVGTVELHKCYADLVVRDFQELTAPPESALKPNQLNIHINPESKKALDSFESVVNDAYPRLFQIATRYAPEGAVKREIHISTMGLLHDFFNFIG